MIKLNLGAYLESRGVELEHGFYTEAADELNINRATLKKYLEKNREVSSVDLVKLSKLGEHICKKYQLANTDLLQHMFVWESFEGIFASSSTRYHVGSVLLPGHVGEEYMTSQNDQQVVESLQSLNQSKAQDSVLVNYRVPADSAGGIDELELANAKKLLAEASAAEIRTRVLIGSSKVNLLTLTHLAELFGIEDATEGDNEQLPIGLIPRKNEHVPGCLTNTGLAHPPGLIFRDGRNNWKRLAFEEGEGFVRKDAGIVVVDYNHDTLDLNVTLFGFSGKGTLALGEHLAAFPKEISWPPSTKCGDLLVDIYAFEFVFNEEGKSASPRKHVMSEAVLKSYLPQNDVVPLKNLNHA